MKLTKENKDLIHQEMKEIINRASIQIDSLEEQDGFDNLQPKHLAELIIKIINEEIDKYQ